MTDYEREARRRKAAKIAEWCRLTGLSAETVVSTFPFPEIRKQMCLDAGVNPASAQTWELVVGLLAAFESPAYQAAVSADDPFAGLG